MFKWAKRAAWVVLATTVLLSLVALYLVVDRNIEDSTFRTGFLETPGVTFVNDYFNHEGYRSADLSLSNGGRLIVGNFDISIFSETDFFSLKRIGGLNISCQSEYQGKLVNILSAFNIVDFAGIQFPNLKVRNIEDVVSNYDRLYSQLEQQLMSGSGMELPVIADGSEASNPPVVCHGVIVE